MAGHFGTTFLLRSIERATTTAEAMLAEAREQFSGLSEDARRRSGSEAILKQLESDVKDWASATVWLKSVIARTTAIRQRPNIDCLLEAYYKDLMGHDSGPSSASRHAVKMLDEMFKMEDPVKLNRWLGFVQGVMYMQGLRTVDQLRDETRGAVHAEFTGWPIAI